MSSSEVIVVKDLRKSYGGIPAVDGISFVVHWGEVFGIVGPNGAGKTTTVECLVGLRKPEAGTVRVLGLDPVRQARELHRCIGVHLQGSALPDGIKVWEALALFASLYPDQANWRALLKEWGLEGKRNGRFSALSGGQRQRLFVALALVSRPRLLLLDELPSGLDPEARRAGRELIRALRDRGVTVVLVTHSMDEAEALCDRLAVIDRGRILALDTPRKLVQRHGRTLEEAYFELTGGAARFGEEREERVCAEC